MIKWPDRALGALRALFEPLQDIDVYVEDANDEVFYTHLLKRVGDDRVRVARVFAKSGRASVVQAARSHDHSARRAFFLIDGDLEWVLGRPAPAERNLFRLGAYCIENLLICRIAASHLLMQDAAMTEEAASEALKFDDWLAEIQEPLVRLFVAFACANAFAPEIATVSLGVGRLCVQVAGTGETRLDMAKVESARKAAVAAAALVAAAEDVARIQQEVYARATTLPVPLHIASGKDFLLPLLDFRLQVHGCRVRRTALRIRLAHVCDLGPFVDLRIAMERAARGAM